MKFCWATLTFVLMAAVSAMGQVDAAVSRNRCTLRIDVVHASGSRVTARYRVELLRDRNSFPVGVRNTDNSGVAEFSELEPNFYRVKVSGDDIETVDSGVFEIDAWNTFTSKTITVQRKVAGPQAPGATISALDLSLPEKAVKEYNKGSKEMLDKNWNEAIAHLNKAVEIAPQFAAAYNNLGVSYGNLGQKDRQRESLQKAINANQRCVPALVNLARLSMDDKKGDPAELLNRALVAEPSNVEAMSLRAHLYLQQGEFEKAIELARKAHTLPHKGFAVVHYTAATAFEHLGKIADAVAELNIFLGEEPQGPRADFVRKALPTMQKEAEARAR